MRFKTRSNWLENSCPFLCPWPISLLYCLSNCSLFSVGIPKVVIQSPHSHFRSWEKYLSIISDCQPMYQKNIFFPLHKITQPSYLLDFLRRITRLLYFGIVQFPQQELLTSDPKMDFRVSRTLKLYIKFCVYVPLRNDSTYLPNAFKRDLWSQNASTMAVTLWQYSNSPKTA